MIGDELNNILQVTYIVKNQNGQEIGEFSDISEAVFFIRAVSMEESRKEFLTWLVGEMFERKVSSPSDIPERVRESKQYELVDLCEKRFIIEGRKNE